MGESMQMDITLHIPTICPECKFTNFKFNGSVRYGEPYHEVRCERCGTRV